MSYISETEQDYVLYLQNVAKTRVLDEAVFFCVALHGPIRSAADLEGIEDAQRIAKAVEYYKNLVGNWSKPVAMLQASLSRLEEQGLLVVRDGIWHVKNA